MAANTDHYDAIVIGAGFGGIYMLKKLLDQGLRVKVIDSAGDVGGTWYWNRYPGAMSDTEAYIYRYSWDKEDLLSYHWDEHYVKQPQVLAYLKHVVERHNLRQHFQFETEMVGADYDEERNIWKIQTSTKETFTCRYLITALGLLSKQNWPDIPGRTSFKGEMYHTGNWPKTHDFTGKRVGIIGNGSTGVQVITALGKENKIDKLYCFQRSPQYSVPSGDGPVTAEYRHKVNQNYDQIWDQVKNSMTCFGFKESTVPCMSVTPAERQRKFQEAWDIGNGFRFMFWTFSDISTDPEANEEACKFIRSKIREKVKDPEKAEKLCPHDFYARRPLCDAGYYEQFNNPKVDIVSLKQEPIETITERGIKTSKQEYELDVLIFATGFDAVDGNYTRVAIRGRKGQSLKDHWAGNGPTSYFGLSVSDFPNLFTICGPLSGFTNLPPLIELHVELIGYMIAEAEKDTTQSLHKQGAVIEATPEAEQTWLEKCDEVNEGSLFRRVDSWIFGANIPGKTYSSLFFFGGMQEYRRLLQQAIDADFKGWSGLNLQNGSGIII